MIATHLFTRIWLEGDTLRMASLENDWLKAQIDGGKLSIPHMQHEDDIVLTASTQELQKFVLEVAEDAGAFPHPGKLIRSK